MSPYGAYLGGRRCARSGFMHGVESGTVGTVRYRTSPDIYPSVPVLGMPFFHPPAGRCFTTAANRHDGSGKSKRDEEGPPDLPSPSVPWLAGDDDARTSQFRADSGRTAHWAWSDRTVHVHVRYGVPSVSTVVLYCTVPDRTGMMIGWGDGAHWLSRCGRALDDLLPPFHPGARPGWCCVMAPSLLCCFFASSLSRGSSPLS
jgi:hypothetical protein